MRRISFVVAVASIVSVMAFPGEAVTCPSAAPPPISFADPVFIDRSRAGGEPVSVVAHDGSIVVSAHAGTTHIYKDPQAAPGYADFAVGYGNQTLNWRSTDGGSTWDYVGTAGLPAGPHSPTSTGFSDPDLTIDAGGRIYNTEIDLANVAVFSSPDDGQSWPYANPVASTGDRPWLTGGDPGEVFLYVNTLRQLWRSTDGGITFELVATGIAAYGKLLNDPLNFSSGLIGPRGDGIAMSADDGKTWRGYDGAGLGPSTSFFGAVAVDRAGNSYAAAAGGYGGPRDARPDGSVTFNYFDRSTMQWGPQAVTIPTPPGDALWPWVIAGDDGRVAVTWLQSLAGQPREFYLFVAYTLNGHGSTITCSDGSQRSAPPTFAVANASHRPIHVGDICQSGTTCNVSTNASAGDRRLGDFHTINFDHLGNIFVVSGDTTLPNPIGGPKPVANPIFVKQSFGAKLLVRPDRVRQSSCLFPLTTC